MVERSYPSLLESSDFDGGSSVAVLTYLRHILESIEHPDLVGSIFGYLLAKPVKPTIEPTLSTRPTTLARRRKSQNLINSLSSEEQKPSPDLFTLVDLLLTSLRGRNQQAVTATLQLCSVLLRKFHSYTFSALVKVQPAVFPDDQRTLTNHEKNTTVLWTMVNSVADAFALENSYEAHVHDAHILTENHPCSMPFYEIPDINGYVNETRGPPSFVFKSQSLERHRITLGDPFLASILVQLQYFFFNDIDTNLGLTQVVVDLASCGLTQLEGWLLGDFKLDEHDPVDLEQQSHTLTDEERLSPQAPKSDTPEPSHISPIFDVLESLVHQVEQYRQKIVDFDEHLTELRKMLANDADVEIGTKTVDTLQNPFSHDGSTLAKAHHTLQAAPGPRKSTFESTIDSVSRSSSPRGRQSGSILTPTLVGRLNHLHISPSRSSSQSTSRTHSVSPLRNSFTTSIKTKAVDVTKGPATAFYRRVNLLTLNVPSEHHLPLVGDSETSSARSISLGSEAKVDETREVALGHLLTNVVVLQEFILELTAIVEVRAVLLDEIRFAG